MKSIITLLALGALAAQTVMAEDRLPQPRGQFEEMRTRMFSEFKQIESTSHKERIAILQQAESCIQAATNRDQYRACEDREKVAREQSNERAKTGHQALKARMEQMRPSLAMNRN
jgi:hypothetical protein